MSCPKTTSLDRITLYQPSACWINHMAFCRTACGQQYHNIRAWKLLPCSVPISLDRSDRSTSSRLMFVRSQIWATCPLSSTSETESRHEPQNPLGILYCVIAKVEQHQRYVSLYIRGMANKASTHATVISHEALWNVAQTAGSLPLVIGVTVIRCAGAALLGMLLQRPPLSPPPPPSTILEHSEPSQGKNLATSRTTTIAVCGALLCGMQHPSP